MPYMNVVVLAGNLTRDPEKRYTPNNVCIASLSMAVNRRVKRNEEWTDEVSFFDVTVFGNTAENCAKFLSKGRPVLVEGYLRQRRWETPEGNRRSKVEVVANNVQFLGPKPGASDSGGSDNGYDEPPPLEDDDIPF